MHRHGSGQDLGFLGELAYRVFRRLPFWAALAVPFAVFVLLLTFGEVVWSSNRAWTGWVAPVIAFALSMLVFEMVVLTQVMASGRFKLLRLQTSLRDIRSQTPRDFERLVGAMYEQQGYTVDYADRGADGGVDLVMHRNGDKVLVQCKNWHRSWTGVAQVTQLFGVLSAEHADRAIFVTSGVFSDEAIEFARGKPLELVDGERLLEGVEGVHRSATPVNKAKLCPICKSPTVRKLARQGPNAGREFWSCSRYPACNGIAPE